MAESISCFICNKPSTKNFCIGCQKYFCAKDFKKHEEKLSIEFDNEVIRSHDEILDQIQKLKNPTTRCLDFFDEIEQWKQTRIKFIEKAAEKVRYQLIESIDKHRITWEKELEPITEEIRNYRDEENFLEPDIDRLKQQINTIQKELQKFRHDIKKRIVVEDETIDWNRLISIRKQQENLKGSRNQHSLPNKILTRMIATVAGGNGYGATRSQLHNPWGICIDDNGTIYIADSNNHRIVEWKRGTTIGRVVAGGNGSGNGLHQLNYPKSVILDKATDSLIICDYGNSRIVRWPRQNGSHGDIIVSNISCWSATIDNNGDMYVVDHDKHEVKRFRIGTSQGKIVAGGNGPGNRLDQLNNPTSVFVDRDQSVYVSDMTNNRVMKWIKGAKQGILVAGNQTDNNSRAQLSYPHGMIVDEFGGIYVASLLNNQVIYWPQGATQGDVIIGHNDQESQSNKLSNPIDLSFDKEGNLYVVDNNNHRVQMFNIRLL